MLEHLKKSPLVPVLRKIRFDDSSFIVKALIEGGVRTVEITMETERATEIIRKTVDEFGSQSLVGAGTVLTIEDCSKAIDAGAQFIVAPVLNKLVVEYAVKQGIPVIPGVYTPSEMMRAYELGATAVKLFPAASVGPGFVKDVQGPLGHIPIMVTGGIDLANAHSYIEAGAIAVGAGSALLNKSHISTGDWDALKRETKKWMSALMK